MHKSAILALFFALLVWNVPSRAQNQDPNPRHAFESLPPILIAGLDAYKEKGPEGAVRAWIKGSPLDESKDALSQSNNLRQIQDFYGSYKAYEVISVRDLTPRTRVYFLALDYEKGPLFARFVLYRTDQGWILTTFKFHTDFTTILPTLTSQCCDALAGSH